MDSRIPQFRILWEATCGRGWECEPGSRLPFLHLDLESSSCVSLDSLTDLSVPQGENEDMMLLSTWDNCEDHLSQKTWGHTTVATHSPLRKFSFVMWLLPLTQRSFLVLKAYETLLFFCKTEGCKAVVSPSLHGTRVIQNVPFPLRREVMDFHSTLLKYRELLFPVWSYVLGKISKDKGMFGSL